MMNEFDRLTTKRNEAKEKKKRVLLTGIVICIVVIIVLAFMILHYQRVDAHTFKLFIDDQQMQFSEGFYFNTEAGETYVRAKDIANYIQWGYQNGEYGSYTEDSNSGYLQNEYEISSFVAGSDILKKYIEVTAVETEDEAGETIKPYETNSPNGTLETVKLALPVISQNGQIYFPLRCLNDICNCSVTYTDPYRMYIYEQKFLITLAQQNAANFGYTEISGIYENMRLLPYGMMVVSNGSFYGVSNLYSNNTVIGLKYTDMVFAQNVKEFFVKTVAGGEETVGIINANGDQVVPPRNYSNIQVLSDELGLYLVEKDGQYGVLDRKGEVVVHCEYDSIGIPENVLTAFNFSVEDNKYILFDNTIVVEKDGKYGFYNVDGDQTLVTAYAGLGYVVEEDEDSVRNSEDVLTIELEDLKLSDGTTRDVKAIIIKQETADGIKYGVFDSESGKLILGNYDRIYGITSKGNTEYYIEFQGQRAKFADQLAAYPYIFEQNSQ